MDIDLTVALQRDEPDFIWFHPRAAAIPAPTSATAPTVLMTLQKHLLVSDYYSELYFMKSADSGKIWTAPVTVPELAWRTEPGDLTVAVADVTPGWHAPTGTVLAPGIEVRYNRQGQQVQNGPRWRQTAYTVYDPRSDTWLPWQALALPDTERKFFSHGSGCSQWLTDADGTVLIPIYFHGPENEPAQVTVVRCNFDGRKLTYQEHGDEFRLDIARGLCEPSLVRCGHRCFLTLRNDDGGYVTAGDDGLHFAPIKPWTFDDGSELGSYNTQQHWLTSGNELFLVYTRRGANNDHIVRHRAPLFIAQVDMDRLCVLRDTEQIVVPEAGAPLGNFGVATVTDGQSWVTTAEFMWPRWNEQARKRGAAGRVFVARVCTAPS